MNSPNVKEDTDYFTPHYKDPLYVLGSSKKRDNYFVKQQWINNLKNIIVNKTNQLVYILNRNENDSL